MSDYDVVIAGGGHNALACGAYLAKHGLCVCVVERNPWYGGGTVTREVTLPGFKHDLFGSAHLWIHANPYFNEMRPEFEKHGLEYIWSEDHIEGHPNTTGPGIIVYKDVDKTCDSIAEYSKKDAGRYREICEEFIEIKDAVVKGMFSPPNPPSYVWASMENNPAGLKRLREYTLSSRSFAMENFENEHVRVFIMGWAMAPQILPDQEMTGQSLYIMIPGVHVYGQAIPKGGSMMLAKSMANYIEAHGGKVVTGATVSKFIIEANQCKGLETENGDSIFGTRAVVSELEPRQTFLRLIGADKLDSSFVSMVRNYQFGNVSIARVHYALHEAPRFNNGHDMDQTGYQRIFGSVADIDRQYSEIMMGIPPTRPFLWTACWTKRDASRAPQGKHTFIMDTFVPYKLTTAQNWEGIKEDYIRDVLLTQLRRHTGNMDDGNILGQYIETGDTLQQANWSFVDGNTTGGMRIQGQMGYFRPFPGYAHYRSPVKNLYMTGPHCHPGGGITAQGMIAANVMLEDLGIKDTDDFDF